MHDGIFIRWSELLLDFLADFVLNPLPIIKFQPYKYLILTEFEVCSVSYGPSFFLLIYSLSAKRAGHKSTGKDEDP